MVLYYNLKYDDLNNVNILNPNPDMCIISVSGRDYCLQRMRLATLEEERHIERR